jgi:GrpB-like predicted nucleotidyltransferase (UPF0157 family)
MWHRLAFRDYLRAHPEECEAYERLKRRLATEHRADREAYTEAKSAFVESVMRKATRQETSVVGVKPTGGIADIL